MNLKKEIDNIIKLIKKKPTTKTKKIFDYKKTRKSKTDQLEGLAIELSAILGYSKNVDQTKGLAGKNLNFINDFQVIFNIDSNYKSKTDFLYKDYEKVQNIECITSLKKMLTTEYDIPANKFTINSDIETLYNLWALYIFYSLPVVVPPAIELRIDYIMSRVVEKATTLTAVLLLRVFPTVDRLSASSVTHKQKRAEHEKAISEIYNRILQKEPKWISYSSRTQRAKRVLQEYSKKDLGIKSVVNYLKRMEEKIK